ncbi:SRPBCC family protein [Actibacterium sp.]|uniref:SRPBCC family protein n=1 Tax=Actibacterium sp. TaxID=1872125 RepID=UPI0035653037
MPITFNPETDLELVRTLNASPEALYRCWTEADLLKQWFCPAPVTVPKAVLDPRPGGRFYTLMRLPDGTELSNDGSYLIADPAGRIAFTDSLHAGFRPSGAGFMTAVITFDPSENGTRYVARVLHATAEDRAKHEEMGFHQGWDIATRQLEALAGTL